jgi:AhpD family alkylhydroperoxidase
MSIDTFPIDGNSSEQPRMDLARSAPEAHRAMVALDAAVGLDPALRDVLSLRASVLNGCAFCIDLHTRDARARGETEQRLHAVAAWHTAPFSSERERAALRLTDAITLVADTHVPAAAFEAARNQFTDEELGRLIPAIIAINAWNRVAVATRMRPEAHHAEAHR